MLEHNTPRPWPEQASQIVAYTTHTQHMLEHVLTYFLTKTMCSKACYLYDYQRCTMQVWSHSLVLTFMPCLQEAVPAPGFRRLTDGTRPCQHWQCWGFLLLGCGGPCSADSGHLLSFCHPAWLLASQCFSHQSAYSGTLPLDPCFLPPCLVSCCQLPVFLFTCCLMRWYGVPFWLCLSMHNEAKWLYAVCCVPITHHLLFVICTRSRLTLLRRVSYHFAVVCMDSCMHIHVLSLFMINLNVLPCQVSW